MKVEICDDPIQSHPVFPFGFHAVPTKESPCLVLFSGSKSVVIGGSSEKIRALQDQTPGAVQMIAGDGSASLLLKDGKIHVKCDNFVLEKADLLGTIKGILGILEETLTPGSATGQGPVTFNPSLLAKIKALKAKWS
jgi:hypothetical protein